MCSQMHFITVSSELTQNLGVQMICTALIAENVKRKVRVKGDYERLIR